MFDPRLFALFSAPSSHMDRDTFAFLWPRIKPCWNLFKMDEQNGTVTRFFKCKYMNPTDAVRGAGCQCVLKVSRLHDQLYVQTVGQHTHGIEEVLAMDQKPDPMQEKLLELAQLTRTPLNAHPVQILDACIQHIRILESQLSRKHSVDPESPKMSISNLLN